MTINNLIQKLKNSLFIRGGMDLLDSRKEIFTNAAVVFVVAFAAVAGAAAFAAVAIAAGASAIAAGAAVATGIAGAGAGALVNACKKGKRNLAGFLAASTLLAGGLGYGAHKGIEYINGKNMEQPEITDIYNKSAACTQETSGSAVRKLCDIKIAP